VLRAQKNAAIDRDGSGSLPLTSRQELGKLSEQRGRSFEERVVETYKLLHYQVEHGRLFSGRQVDIFLIGHFGDLTVHRAIECKAGPVSVDDLDVFLHKLVLVHRDYPGALGTIVSGISFTDAVTAHAAAIGVQLTLLRDLSGQLLDGHGYARSLLRELEDNQRYPLPIYVEPSIGYDTVGDSMLSAEVISDWLADGAWNQLTLLGDVGAGKTFLSRIITHRLLLDFLKTPLDRPLPIRIDLRNADREFSLEGLILTHLSRVGLVRTSFDVFMYLLAQGRIVLILDGFDEMAARVTPAVTRKNFFELTRCVQGRAKIMLTCRTHYFRSQKEEGEVVLGGSEAYRSEGARDLYWDLIARRGFRIAYLRPFQFAQIEQYVANTRPHDFHVALKKIKSIYNLLELSQRPLLLEMIVKSLDKLGDKDINASSLYQVFTDAWIHRDRWRDVLSPESKLQFLMSLACNLWKEDMPAVHYAKLRDFLQVELQAEVDEPQKLFEIDNEVRTASFLTRDNLGNYGFAHKSYMEFFLARHLASRLILGEENSLSLSRLTSEVLGFLRDMIDLAGVADLCEKILQSDYKPRISENALLILYSIRSASLGADASEAACITLLPDMRLCGAQLDYVVLERAILERADLSDANLKGVVLAGSRLTKTTIDRAILDKADLSGAVLDGCSFKGTSAESVNLFKTNICNAVLDEGSSLARIFSVKDLRSGDNHADEREHEPSLDDAWQFIKEIYPELSKVARWSARYLARILDDVDPDDLRSLLILKILKPDIIAGLRDLTGGKRLNYLYRVSERIENDYFRSIERGGLIFVDLTTLADYQGSHLNYIKSDENPEEQAIASDFVAKLASRVRPDIFRVAYAYYVEGRLRSEIAESESVSLVTVSRRLAEWRKAALSFIRIY
jgi:uncharacterized protein YjbI with pentapeptide repeats